MLSEEGPNQMIKDKDINCVVTEKLRGITNKISGNIILFETFIFSLGFIVVKLIGHF